MISKKYLKEKVIFFVMFNGSSHSYVFIQNERKIFEKFTINAGHFHQFSLDYLYL
jgi:hypothetical protein